MKSPLAVRSINKLRIIIINVAYFVKAEPSGRAVYKA
jgi:hypothetical protein